MLSSLNIELSISILNIVTHRLHVCTCIKYASELNSKIFSLVSARSGEPAVWLPAAQVQEQQRLAEALGRVHQLLPLLLQNLPGRLPASQPPPARL